MSKKFKIAFLLTLYGNVEQANLFINQLLEYEETYVFIHIDQKGFSIKNSILKHDRVKIMPTSFQVEWGDFSQIESILALMEYAKEYGKFDYFSLHSGNDLLIRPICELVEFLGKDNKYAYLLCDKLPSKCWQYGGGLGRIALYWPKLFRKKYGKNSVLRYARSIYGKMYGAKIIRGKKLPADITFYGRSDWFTMREDCITDILEYVSEHPEFIDLFRNSLIGSEIFFVTLAHMKGQHKNISSNNNLRYINFIKVDPKTPGSPKLLRMEDYKEIVDSKMFFARKFDLHIDKEIIMKFVESKLDEENIYSMLL
jgi:Core-2/I-Branching enzyme.